MDVSVITVTWNSEKDIAAQIRSVISAMEPLEYEQIVVDNHSADNTVAVIEENFPAVKIIKNDVNAGFARACNEAVKIARGRYFLFLNPDMEILRPLAPLVSYMDSNPPAGIVSAKLVDGDGRFNPLSAPRRLPRWWEVILIFLKVPHFFPKILAAYQYADRDWNVVQEVDSVRGSFTLTRRELADKLGWAFDPRYFIWWEDVDLCREARRLGYKVIYHPAVVCVDKVGQSFNRRHVAWKQRQFFGSWLKYFLKWAIKN